MVLRISPLQSVNQLELIEASVVATGHQHWIETITLRYHARLRILRSKRSRGRDGVLQLIEVIVDQKSKQELIEEIRADPEVSELAITHSGQGRLVGLIRAKGLIMRCIADSDCFLAFASNGAGKEIEWRVLGTKRSLKGLLRKLAQRRVDYRIDTISEVRPRRGITPRREWLLQTAFERGYFDFPKRIRIRALAKEVGVSAPTLFESLRKTERRVLEDHFMGGRLDTVDTF